jgi:MFS family permease
MFTFQLVSTHMVPHATDVGISPSAAAAALGLMGGFSIFGRVSSGLFSARLGWHRLLSLSYFGMSASMVCLLVLKEIWMLHVFAFSYGVFHGVRISSLVGVLPEIFGMRSLGEAIGLTAAAGQLISAFSPYLVGALFDTRGSYSLAFLLTAILLVAGGVVAGLVKRIAVSTSPPPHASK